MGWFPRVITRTAALRLPGARRASLRFLAQHYPTASAAGDVGTSQVPGEPSCTCPVRPIPVGSLRPAVPGAVMWPSASTNASAPTTTNFRDSITRPAHSLCTLRHCRYRQPRNTRFRLGASLDRSGFEPAGFRCKVSARSSLLPPCPSFAWRTMPIGQDGGSARRRGTPYCQAPVPGAEAAARSDCRTHHEALCPGSETVDRTNSSRARGAGPWSP